MVSDALCQGCLAGIGDGKDAVFGHEGVELLLVVGNVGGQRREVPVQVGVALLAAEAQRVHSFGWYGGGYGAGDHVRDCLEAQELVRLHVVHPVLEVCFGRDQAVAQQRRVAAKEGDRVAVLVDDVVLVVGVAGDQGADKARPLPNPALVLTRSNEVLGSGWSFMPAR